MTDGKPLRVDRIEYHRNGVGGNGFHVVAFHDRDGQVRGRPMLAVVFDEPGSIAVLDVGKINANKWSMAEGAAFRGDHYESEIRAAIAKDWKEYERGNSAHTTEEV